MHIRKLAEGTQVLRQKVPGSIPEDRWRASAAETGEGYSADGAEVLEVRAGVYELGSGESDVYAVPAGAG